MTAQLPIATEFNPMVLKFHPVINMTDEQLFYFCQLNKVILWLNYVRKAIV
ncbi:hypothetical protein NIES267_20310 [Calothrix parasitica NIES-267]|uniref:Uncharacterized protein n=1 Tax=Calothrix parasitica NIES-267 TaxID=1973488 RepID=A0A1Z4LMT5_9CYAN|nr:hypothetical protein NIES267_20310 [Calothrix parasitica NIES-267]